MNTKSHSVPHHAKFGLTNIIMTKPLRICFLLCIGLLFLRFFHAELQINAPMDMMFEGVSLIILIYIFLTSYRHIREINSLLWGSYLLLGSRAFDFLSESDFIDTWVKQLDFMDNFLEDTLTQVSYMLLAYGVTQIIKHHEKASYTDDLTGLYNRKYLNKIRMNVFELVYFDLNNLKTTNDTLGHQHGDTLIVNFAHLLKQRMKKTEVAIRVGGDEFVAIVHKGNGERLIKSLKQDTKETDICFSYGMSQGHVKDLDHIIAMADERMYEMKKECIK